MTAFDYSSGSRITNVLGHTVYAKAAWGDSWVAVPNLTCVECAWNAAPNFNTALLQWETGYVVMPGDATPTLFGTWVGRGQFIRIVWSCDDGGTLTWVGFVDSSSWPTEAFGRQQIVCYGLERSLALTPIATSAWLDDSGSGSPVVRRSGLPYTFNEGPDGYRSADDVSGVYLFASQHDPTAAINLWSTRQIVQYLMTYCLPTNAYGVAAIPWALNQAAQLPDWDTPIVTTRNRTLWDVLQELINPENQLGFTVGSDGSTAYLRCFTHLASAVTYGSTNPRTIPANPNQHSVVFAPDALTQADLSDVGATYDQVIVRGDRRKTICTLLWDDHLEANNWFTSLYGAAASTNTDYATWTLEEKRIRNQAKRDQEKETYREFRIKSDWNYEIDGDLIFINPDNPNPRSIRILETIPIKKGEDWTGDADDAPHTYEPEDSEYLIPLVEDPTSDQDRLNLVTQLGLLNEKQVSALSNKNSYTIHVTANNRIIDIRVEGTPQHVIASGNFTPLSGVDLPVSGGIDYQTLGVTVCLEEDRFCEGVYPTSVSADVVRRLVIDLGDRYRQIYVVPNTVTGLDEEGARTFSNGGWLIDHSEDLATLARLIATGLVPSRKRASWRSQRRISGIAVGDLITTAAGATIAAPVTEIRINAPTGDGRPPSAPTQSFATFAGLFDPMQLLRRIGVIA
jgi:hypothetical protein